MSGRAVLVAALVVVLAATSVGLGAVAVQRGRALDEAREKVARLEEVLAEQYAPDPGAEAESDGPSGLDDLLDGALDDLLGDDLLGGLGGAQGLEGLLDGGLGGPAAACMTAGGRLEVDDDDGEQQYDDVLAAVEVLRELELQRPVEPTYLTPRQLSQRVAELVAAELDEAPVELERRRLVAFGALDDAVDFEDLLVELYASQVAGFYDSESEEMVVGATDPSRPLSALDQMVLAHELTHAVTDQVHDLDQLLEAPDPDAADPVTTDVVDSDGDLAALAVVEGDATIVGNRFLVSTVGPLELLEMLTDPRAAGGSIPPGVPSVLEQELTFPYLDGAEYVCDLLQSGGWASVDAAYADPPATTAEVLFADRRGEPQPQAPEQLSAPGAGYEVLGDDTLGAARLSWLFAAPGEDPDAALDEPGQRVRGWDGDALRVWADGQATAVGLVVGDRGGGPPLCGSVGDWYDAAITDDAPSADDPATDAAAEGRAWQGGRQSAVLRCEQGTVALAIAPTLDAASRMHE